MINREIDWLMEKLIIRGIGWLKEKLKLIDRELGVIKREIDRLIEELID